MAFLRMAFLVLVALATPAEAALLIGHWGFEEGSGNTAINSSSNAGLDGAISNAVYTTDAVRGNYALAFNGSNSFVQVANNPLLVPQTIGISLWFKADSTQVTSADLIDKGHGSGSSPYHAGYVFQYAANTSSIDTLYGNGTTFAGTTTGAGHKDNVWHHLVANLGASEISLYIDGALVSQSAGAGSLLDNDSDLFFGRHRTLGRHFNGLLDDIQLYDGALTQSEVTAIFNNAAAVPEPASLAMWSVIGGIGFMTRRKRRQSKLTV